MGSIYFITCLDTGRVKIGYTSGSPEKRLKALQTGSPTILRMLAMYPGTVVEERILHERFGDCRLHGEWFQPNDFMFQNMAFIAWTTAVDSHLKGRLVPEWARIFLLAMNEENQLPDHIRELL